MTRRAGAAVAVREADVPRVGGGWWMTHGLPLVAPGIGCAVWGLLVFGAHLAGGGDPVLTPFLAILALAVGGGITWFMTDSAGQRRDFRRCMLASGVYGTSTLTVGLIVGPVPWMVWTWVVASLIVWALWIIWRSSKYGGATGAGDGTGANALLEMAKDAKVRISKPQVDERGVVRAKVSTLPGGTIDDARGLLGPISAEARAVQGGVALTRHDDVDGLGEIEIATRDNLKAPIAWPGLTPDLLGITPTDWISLGEYQSGPVRMRIVGDIESDRSAPDVSHLKVGGVTGSGKSTGAQVLIGSAMGMRKLTMIGVDVSAELQILGPLAGGFTVPPITDYEMAKLFIHRMTKVVIPGRKAHLAREGLKRWSPRSSLNLMMVVFEESKAFGRLSTAYHAMVSDARAAGIWIISSTQSWLWRNLSTDVRKQHPSGWCFGMSEADDVATVLPDEAIDALGDNLPTWADRKPGYSYFAHPSVPARSWSKMMRAYDPQREQLLAAVELGRPYRDLMDEVTASLFGDVFAGHQHPARGPVPAAVGRPVARISTPTAGADIRFHEDGEESEVDSEFAEEYETERSEELAELEAQRRRDLGDDATASDLEAVDADQPIPQLGDDDAEEEEPEDVVLTPQQAQRVWDERLHELWARGVRHLKTSDLTEWLGDVGRERPFLYRQRDRWIGLGCIIPRDDAEGWDLIASPLEAALDPPHGE